MKLPYLRTRKYKNQAGEISWVGYYYEPPRGSGGQPGVKPKPIALGSDQAAALAKYAELTKQTVQIPARKDNTVGQGAADYFTWAWAEVTAGRLSGRTLRDYEECWDALKPVFAKGPMDGLSQPVLMGYFDKRSSKDRGKRELAWLGLLCSWAKPRGRMTVANPVDRGFRLQLKVTHRKRPTVPVEVYLVVWHCGDQLVRDTMDLSLICGTRPAEALVIPMPAPDFEDIEVPTPKTKRHGTPARRVKATPEMRALIERRRALQPLSLYVLFDEHGQQLRLRGTIRYRFEKARDLARQICEKAKITWVEWSIKDLRPTAGTSVDRKAGMRAARLLLGHSTEKQTAHYIRSDGEEAAIAADLPAQDDALWQRVALAKRELEQQAQASETAAVEKSFRH